MADKQLGAVETRFAELIWENEPLSSRDLVGLCETALHWKKSTTYTVLRRLCDRGLFQNRDGVVTPLLSRQEYRALRSEDFLRESFGGSLPQFLAAFTLRRKLSRGEIEELQRFIDANRGET